MAESKLQNRNFTIDRFRGIVIFSMIIFQFMANFTGLGGGIHNQPSRSQC